MSTLLEECLGWLTGGLLGHGRGRATADQCPACRIEIVEARPDEGLPPPAPCTRPGGCPHVVRRLAAVAPEDPAG